MPEKKQVKQTYKKLTPEEDAEMRRKIEEEERARPANEAMVRRRRAEHARLRELMGALKTERERQGLSLSQMSERAGMDASDLHQLETNERANPTLDTVQRLAHALGKQIYITLADEAA